MLNIDWNAPKTPCQTEGCNWPSYHVCLVGKPDLFPSLLRAELGRRRKGVKLGPMPQRQRDNVSRALIERWERYDEQFAERNAEIAERYEKETLSLRALGIEYGISKTSVIKILRKAGVAIRPRGLNIRHGAA